MPTSYKIRGTYGKPWSQMGKFDLTPETLKAIGECMVNSFKKEALKDFAKRGWSVRDPMGGPDIGDSFSYRVKGKSTVEILSSFYGIAELTRGDIPSRRMTWLTQEAKDKTPHKYKRTPGEQRRQMSMSGRVSKGTRLPLVVPIKSSSGEVIFRTAPLKIKDAWIHPGIAKFNFARRAVEKGRKLCLDAIQQQALDMLIAGDPTR